MADKGPAVATFNYTGLRPATHSILRPGRTASSLGVLLGRRAVCVPSFLRRPFSVVGRDWGVVTVCSHTICDELPHAPGPFLDAWSSGPTIPAADCVARCPYATTTCVACPIARTRRRRMADPVFTAFRRRKSFHRNTLELLERVEDRNLGKKSTQVAFHQRLAQTFPPMDTTGNRSINVQIWVYAPGVRCAAGGKRRAVDGRWYVAGGSHFTIPFSAHSLPQWWPCVQQTIGRPPQDSRPSTEQDDLPLAAAILIMRCGWIGLMGELSVTTPKTVRSVGSWMAGRVNWT